MLRVLGVDLGSVQDYTALAGVTATGTTTAVPYVGQDPELGLPVDCEMTVAGPPVSFDIGHLERLPLGTSYPAIVDLIAERLRRMPDAVLAVDATGVGRAVVDLMLQRRLDPVCVTITAGETARCEGREWHVPKVDLIQTLQVSLQHKRARFATSLPERDQLVRELLSFEQRTSAAGHTTLGTWREGEHDDAVLAVSIAAYVAEMALGMRARQSLARVEAHRLTQFLTADNGGISPF